MYDQPMSGYAYPSPTPTTSAYGASGESIALAGAIGLVILTWVAGGAIGAWAGSSIAAHYGAPTAIRWLAGFAGFGLLNPFAWFAGIRRLLGPRPSARPAGASAPGIRR